MGALAEVKLGDIYDVHNGLSKGGSFFGSGYPFLSFKTVFNNFFLPPVLPDLVQSNEKEQKVFDIKRGDVFLTRTSETAEELGMSSVALKNYPQATFNGFSKRLRPKYKEAVYPEFMAYYLRSRQFRAQFYGLASSMSTRASLSNDALMELKVYLPSMDNQKRIAAILKPLDDKIDINRRINENLEQQAQALFKSWFVDFEPFKNGEFVESELGMIPKGWRVGTVNDVCCFESGFAFKSTTYKQEGEYRLITIKNVQDGYLDVNGSVCLDELPAKMPQYCLLRIGDVLLSLTGNVGRCCFVDEERLLLNQRVAKLKPRIKNNWGYIYTLFRNPSFKDRVVSIARGTAQANLSPIETSNMIIIIPIDKVLEDFSAIVDESYRIMINNMIESQKLASLRDTLLPKLMSGELKVGDVLL